MRRDSQLAHDLSAALQALGDPVSPRQVERLGAFGLLGPAASELSPSLIARAQEALQLVREYGSGDLAALVLFVRGRDFDKAHLERAYFKALERFEAFIETTAHGLQGYDAAERVGGWLATRAAKSRQERPLRAELKRLRAGRRFISIKQALASFYTDAIMIMIDGHASSEQALLELLQITGVQAITRDALPGKPPPAASLPIERVKQLLGYARLRGQAATVAQASYEQLTTARDDVVALAAFSRIFTPAAQRAFGLSRAFGFAGMASLSELAIAFAIPGMIFIRAVKGDELDRIHRTIEVHTPRFHAINELLDAIPERFYPLSKTVSDNDLSEDERVTLRRVIDTFEETYPEKYKLVMSDVPVLVG